MIERVEVRETGPMYGQRSQILVLHRRFIVAIFQHDDDHAVEMVGTGLSSGLCSIFPLLLRRLRRLSPVGLRGIRRLPQRDRRPGAQQPCAYDDAGNEKQVPGESHPAGKSWFHLTFL